MAKTRELDLQEFVDEIYEDYKKNGNDTEYIFFLGAGCSKSSGIPLASELSKEWFNELKKQKTKFDKFIKNKSIDISKEDEIEYGKYYFDIFEELFPSPLAQQKEIQRITEDKMPSLGYYVLASFLQKYSFNTVITTNFDNLIQDALIYSGNKRALVITHQDLAKFIKRDNTPLITKIHGDAHMHPFNNSGDTKKIPEELKGAIQGLFANAKVIFIGYSGNDESICDLLDGCKRIDQVYWCNLNEPENIKIKKWWEEIDNKTFVGERDFDKIMSLVQSKFKISKPDFNKRAKELGNSYEQALDEEIKDLESIDEKEKTSIDYLILANSYYAKNEYKEAIKAYKKALEDDLENAEINNSIGASYYMIEEYDNAIKYYEKALTKDSDNLVFYCNLLLVYERKMEFNKIMELSNKILEKDSSNINAYFALGRLFSHKESFEKASEYYEKVLSIDKYNQTAYLNLFEIQIILNGSINKNYELKYLSQHNETLTYKMLKTIEEILDGKNIDLDKMLIESNINKFKKIDWSFNELELMAKKKDKTMKQKLFNAFDFFKLNFCLDK